MNIENRRKFLKKLLYKSCNRGCRETDLIVGCFARDNLEKMTNEELIIFEEILNIPDADIYDYYTEKKLVPKENMSPIMQKLLKYTPNK